MTLLQNYGFNAFFEALAGEFPSLEPARVLSQSRGSYRLCTNAGEKMATVSGKLRYTAETLSDYPAVGDFVMADLPEGDGSAVIHTILPRRSVFIRRAAGTSRQEQVVAANIDTVFLCMALNNDFNLRRMERYLSIAWDSGAKPVIVLTKRDLCDAPEARISEVESIAAGTDIAVTSSLGEDGLEQLLPYLIPGKTASFIGSSGVGKSTLINRLAGSALHATNGLRDDDKGRHTTTQRELLLLPCGALVIDTPGMRELGMWSADAGIAAAFQDIEELQCRCRFKNCTHTNEPGCAVAEALRSGSLSPERWGSYQKLRAENAYAENAAGFLAAKEKKFKSIARRNKTNRKK